MPDTNQDVLSGEDGINMTDLDKACTAVYQLYLPICSAA